MSAPIDPRTAWPARCAAIASWLCLCWAILARAIGPSDLWDQTQPKTVSYTTDMVANGGSHWILPIERGVLPATKPPLYNWLAAPCVQLLGFSSEIAHKLPSVAALCGCWLIVVRLGRRIAGPEVGWMAGGMLVASYTMFKLGYLARPDMLLTLWLALAWMWATSVLVRDRTAPPQARSSRSALRVVGFWACIVAAGLTKGPPAAVPVLYALVASRMLAGHWSAFGRLWPTLGIALSSLIVAGWVYAAWRINPDHVVNVLWHDEIWGRVTGTGPEGDKGGAAGWVSGVLNQAMYFIVRFAPWSLPAIIGAFALWRGGRWRALNDAGAWLWASAMFAAIVIAVFTLSAGKRADYIAAAFVPASLVAAWWWMQHRWPVAPIIRRIAMWGGAFVALTAMTIINAREPAAPQPGFGEGITGFARSARLSIEAEPLEVVFTGTGETHLQALMGFSVEDGERSMQRVRAATERGQPFWVVAGRRMTEPKDPLERIRSLKGVQEAREVVRSAWLPRAWGWPEQVSLMWVEPLARPPAPPSSPTENP